jgi:RNA polymerase sigma factor (sigma-70 family)
MILDRELLRRYAEADSEDAFAELVRRHLDLVYSAALRQVNGDALLAQDVAQSVFADLARKAGVLWQREVLTSWLYTSTHFAAANAVRKERRRHTHEQEAFVMHELLQAPTPDLNWEKLRPVLDEVMHELKETDRAVILMRYFENRPFADIGQRLGLSEDAVRKRVDRSLEKLRAFLAKRGISISVALGTVLSANAVQIAPAGLAATLASASLAVSETGTTLTLLKAMTMTKIQAGIIGGILVVSLLTPLAVQQRALAQPERAKSGIAGAGGPIGKTGGGKSEHVQSTGRSQRGPIAPG